MAYTEAQWRKNEEDPFFWHGASFGSPSGFEIAPSPSSYPKMFTEEKCPNCGAASRWEYDHILRLGITRIICEADCKYGVLKP